MSRTTAEILGDAHAHFARLISYVERDLRNRIAHGYLLVNSEIVRQTVDDDLPGIVGVIEDELGVGKR